jgi:hypothetical protein
MGFTPYEGREVVSSGFEAPGAGGGLHKALTVNDAEWHHGDEVTLAVRVRVKKVRYDPVSDDAPVLQRVHVLQVLHAAEIPDDAVADALDAQQRLIEEREGVKRLDFDGANDADEPDAES